MSGETKIDASVSDASISIPGFEHRSFTLDRTLRGGGVVTYVFYFFESVTKVLDVYCAKYDDIILVDDFNTSESEQVLSEFLYEQDMSSLVSFHKMF